MNTVRIYIEENLNTQRRGDLVKMIEKLPHVVDVEIGDNEPHEVVIDYEEHHNMPMQLVEVLRQQGYHPDIISA